jgi:hypothetical protein
MNISESNQTTEFIISSIISLRDEDLVRIYYLNVIYSFTYITSKFVVSFNKKEYQAKFLNIFTVARSKFLKIYQIINVSYFVWMNCRRMLRLFMMFATKVTPERNCQLKRYCGMIEKIFHQRCIVPEDPLDDGCAAHRVAFPVNGYGFHFNCLSFSEMFRNVITRTFINEL